jgi:hypothetical protein
LPVALERLGEPRHRRDHRPGRLHSSAQVAQPSLRGPLVLLSGIVGEAARDLEEAELPNRGRDLLRVLAFVRAAERDPRLEPRARLGRATSRPSRASVSVGPGWSRPLPATRLRKYG